ncbi:MAG: DUF6101 family protein [Parvibaculum sp.]|uniref:DUF6101 family protein n=1 Tax=Parvibaculum sp. TaxID=2024848 RepID=UPI0032658531
MSVEECVQQQKRRKRIWRSGEFDADPFGLPQHVAIKAVNPVERAFGFIRYATVYADAVTAYDSSPILGRFEWSEKMSAYDGVALRILPCDRQAKKFVAIVELSHRANEARNLVVYAGEDGVDASARWRAWGRVLRLPLLIEDREGTLHPAERRLGALHVSDPQPHAGANPLSARRPLTFGQSGQPRLWARRLVVGGRPLAY